VLEVNASFPHGAVRLKATGRPLAKLAAKLMVGKMALDDLGVLDDPVPTHVAVKESVFPFAKFQAWTRSSGPRCDRPRGDGHCHHHRGRVRQSMAASG
jgi:hypothetical protein